MKSYIKYVHTKSNRIRILYISNVKWDGSTLLLLLKIFIETPKLSMLTLIIPVAGIISQIEKYK